jgi:hypothetical protein
LSRAATRDEGERQGGESDSKASSNQSHAPFQRSTPSQCGSDLIVCSRAGVAEWTPGGGLADLSAAAASSFEGRLDGILLGGIGRRRERH